MVPSEGKASLKNPVTPPGIDSGTVRLVAQRLNHYYATPRPHIYIYIYIYIYNYNFLLNFDWNTYYIDQEYLHSSYTVCPTRYRTRHFFNNSNTNEDIATKCLVATCSTCYYVVTFLTQ